MENTKKTVQIRYFSGYIRNWKALCGELGIDPALNRQQREEAIITKAYTMWKLDFMSHIFGMFVIAIYDNDAKKLYIIRDQVGQKHIFYAKAGDELISSGYIG